MRLIRPKPKKFYSVAPVWGKAASPSVPALPSLTGLIGHWDASNTASLTLSGANITNVADQSGVGNHLGDGSSSNKPQYSATGFNTSYPAMVFTGTSSQVMQATGVFNMGTGLSKTCFAVINMSSAAASFARFMSYLASGASGDGNNAGSWCLERNTSNSQLAYERSNNTSVVNITIGSPYRVIVTVDGSGNSLLYLNGVSQLAATNASHWVSGGLFALGATPGGGIPGAAALFWTGTIVEAGVATGYSDATTVGQLDTYLKAKWGL